MNDRFTRAQVLLILEEILKECKNFSDMEPIVYRKLEELRAVHSGGESKEGN